MTPMDEHKVDHIQYEFPIKPSLPRYLFNTKYGQDQFHDNGQEPATTADAVSIPKRRFGEAEVKNWPSFVGQPPSHADAAIGNVEEELPWRLVPSPLEHNKGALLIPSTYNQAEIKPRRIQTRRCVLANRHIPRDVSIYYVEMEGTSLSGASIGLLELNVKTSGRHGAPALTDEGNHLLKWSEEALISDSTSQGEQPPNGSSSQRRSDAADDGSPEYRLPNSQALVADNNGSDVDENAELANAEDKVDEDDEDNVLIDQSDDDDDDDYELNIAGGADDEDEGNESDDDELVGDEDDEDDDDDDDDAEDDDQNGLVSDDDGLLNHTRTTSPIKFPVASVLYNRHGSGRVADDVTLTMKKGSFEAPYCSMDISTQNMFSGKTLICVPPTSTAAQKPTRVGMLVDFVAGEVRFTVDGSLLASSIKLKDSAGEQSKVKRKELFPFFAFAKGMVRVHFGDGSLPHDGFVFDVKQYIDAQPKAFDSKNAGNNIPPTIDLIREYFEYYGYADVLGDSASEEVRQRQRVRTCIERCDIKSARRLLDTMMPSSNLSNLSNDVKFALDFAEYVALARSLRDDEPQSEPNANGSTRDSPRQQPQLVQVLDLGKRLLKSAEHDPELQQRIREASGILVTREPRSPELTKFYDDEAKSRLLDIVFQGLNTQRHSLPSLKTLSEHAYAVSCKRPVSNRRVAHAVALLRNICDGEHWRW